MRMPSVDKMCNIAGCALIVVLLLLLVFKPNGLTSLFEGQGNNTVKNNNSTIGFLTQSVLSFFNVEIHKAKNRA